ncbi:MAG: potassium channel protein [Firmicutes bacterium HGW-Firmicutes-20]|jgi:voltage-gated potassium channel|nr:MAG: potassium channel protein [Firmicutes bacterium HGW-Firmicutes-20]PKM89305.1 MAG: potassium channel protein [Firmicutes bacterium HGW-Firmicutes-10]
MVFGKRIAISLFILLLLVLTGTLGYRKFLSVSWTDALYMTIITISTVGYQEVAPMTSSAKLFSVALILVSLGTVGYLLTNVASLLFESNVMAAIRRRKMENAIEKLYDHYIVCGCGETGSSVIDYLTSKKVPFVVIDNNEEIIASLNAHGILAFVGNATQEEILAKAQIARAKGLIASLSRDSFNVYTVLTARGMNPDLYIVAKAIEKGSDEKLKKAGANNTISPNEIGGRRLAASLVRPSIISFLDAITMAGEVELDLEEVVIHMNSVLNGVLLREARIPEKTGLIVLAIRKASTNKLIFNPSSDVIFNEGDTMIVLGQDTQVNTLRDLAGGNSN